MRIRRQQHDNNGNEGWAKTGVHAGTQGKLLKDGSALGHEVTRNGAIRSKGAGGEL